MLVPRPDATPLFAPGTDIASLSLDDLLAQPIQVTSQRSERAREAAGVVTVFTRDEILATGARDLGDLLWLVPGFVEALDVENIVGLGVRGIWSYEGKVLLLVDGIDMTELMFSVNPLGMHYLTGNIERVEIIRGPGSAVYGGHAGMAVISLITRGAKDLEGGQVEARYGQMSRTFSDRSVGFNLGKTFTANGELGASLTGYVGQGTRSQGDYLDGDKGRWSLADGQSARTDPLMANARVTWRGLTAKVLYDRYRVTTIDGLGPLTTRTDGDYTVPAPNTQLFETLAADARYRVDVSEHVTLEPRLFLTFQQPWRTADSTESLHYDKSVTRAGAGVTATFDATSQLHLLAGAEAFQADAVVNRADTVGTQSQTDFSGVSPQDPLRAQLQTAAGFAQVAWENPLVNLTLGGRAEWQSVVGASLVPRFAATRSFDRLTAKLLLTGAYRAPDFENLNLSAGTLQPERLWVSEAEVSYQLSDWALVSVNGFVVDVEDLIVYTANLETNAQGYLNAGRALTFGAELELQLRGRHGFLRASYSYAEASRDTTVTNFLAPDTRARLLGMPGHKVTLFGQWKLPLGFSLNPSGYWLSPRSALLPSGELGTTKAAAILNLNARWDAEAALGRPGWSVTLGVNNLLDADLAWVQAYDGGHPPIPGRARDVFVRVGYEHPW